MVHTAVGRVSTTFSIDPLIDSRLGSSDCTRIASSLTSQDSSSFTECHQEAEQKAFSTFYGVLIIFVQANKVFTTITTA